MSSFKSRIQKAAGGLLQRVGVRTVSFEVTRECNQDCLFCYNVWKCGSHSSGQLDTPRTQDLIDRIISGYRPYTLSFTGGEPLMRGDIIELIKHAASRTHCNLITNGTFITDDLTRELVDAGIGLFQFTLLSADRETHNALVGRESFDQLIEAIASVRAAGGRVATTFVATRRNIETWHETLELNAALGVDGILFNRFNVGGAGIAQASALMPSIEQIKTALEVANEGSRHFGISISCGVPILPCVIDRTPYPNISFPDCAVGTRNAYPAVDPLGNVRPCNHSPLVLGNLFESGMASILSSQVARDYARSIPEECGECKHARTCRGGCRAASEACGRCGRIDPFADMCKNEEVEKCDISG